MNQKTLSELARFPSRCSFLRSVLEHYEPKKGTIIKDKDWDQGFFLRTFPYLFICSEDNPTGGDITFIPKDERQRSDVWYRYLVK